MAAPRAAACVEHKQLLRCAGGCRGRRLSAGAGGTRQQHHPAAALQGSCGADSCQCSASLQTTGCFAGCMQAACHSMSQHVTACHSMSQHAGPHTTPASAPCSRASQWMPDAFACMGEQRSCPHLCRRDVQLARQQSTSRQVEARTLEQLPAVRCGAARTRGHIHLPHLQLRAASAAWRRVPEAQRQQLRRSWQGKRRVQVGLGSVEGCACWPVAMAGD
mgnify:CR=1 FL=1